MGKTTFTAGNPSQGIPGTLITAALLNALNNQRHLGRDVDGDGPIDYAADTGSANAYVLALTPALPEYVTGYALWFKAAHANTGASTLNIDGLGVKDIKRAGGAALQPGDIQAGGLVHVVFDGAQFQLVNPAKPAVLCAADSGSTDNAYVLSLTPAIPALYTGLLVAFTSTRTNTGAATLNVNGLGAVALKKKGSVAIAAGDIASGQMMIAVYDGAAWQLLTAPLPAIGNQGELMFHWNGVVSADPTLKYNPSTQILSVANLSGNAATATNASNGYNPGDFKIISSPDAPAGFLKCNGAVISRTAYAVLFAAIGIRFGAGDGSTTFNLPDLRGEFVRGWDDSRGVDSGRTLGSTQGDAFQGHTHSTEVSSSPNPYDMRLSGGSSLGLTDRTLSGGIQAYSTYGTPRVASETRPRNIALMFCIKY